MSSDIFAFIFASPIFIFFILLIAFRPKKDKKQIDKPIEQPTFKINYGGRIMALDAKNVEKSCDAGITTIKAITAVSNDALRYLTKVKGFSANGDISPDEKDVIIAEGIPLINRLVVEVLKARLS